MPREKKGTYNRKRTVITPSEKKNGREKSVRTIATIISGRTSSTDGWKPFSIQAAPMDRLTSVARKYLNARYLPGKMETDEVLAEDLPRPPLFHPIRVLSGSAAIKVSRASPNEFTCLAYFHHYVGRKIGQDECIRFVFPPCKRREKLDSKFLALPGPQQNTRALQAYGSGRSRKMNHQRSCP